MVIGLITHNLNMLSTDSVINLKEGGLLWFDLVPNQITEAELLARMGAPTRKIEIQDGFVYLFANTGAVPDAATIKNGIVTLMDYAPTRQVTLEEISNIIGESFSDSESSNLVRGATIYHFPKIGLSVTADQDNTILRVSQYQTGTTLRTMTKNIPVYQNIATKPYLSQTAIGISIAIFLLLLSMFGIFWLMKRRKNLLKQ